MVAVGLTDGPENIISKLHNEPNALCKDYENVVYNRKRPESRQHTIGTQRDVLSAMER